MTAHRSADRFSVEGAEPQMWNETRGREEETQTPGYSRNSTDNSEFVCAVRCAIGRSQYIRGPENAQAAVSGREGGTPFSNDERFLVTQVVERRARMSRAARSCDRTDRRASACYRCFAA